MSNDPMLRAYKAALAMEPIVLQDYYVRIRTYTRTRIWGKVEFFEAIPPFQCIDMGAIGAGVQLARQPMGNLDLWDNEFGQWRWFPLDNMQCRVFLPQGVGKWQLRNIQVGIDKSIIERNPTLETTEIYSWEDQRPSIEPLNFSDYALTASRIIVFGFRFLIADPTTAEKEKLEKGQLPFTPIQCCGMPGGSE